MSFFAKTARQLDSEIAEASVRTRLSRRIQKLLDRWQPILGVEVREFHIKKMSSWGSSNPGARRLWVSQSLAGMSDASLEYVVVHEMVHILMNEGPAGSGHNARFYALMDHYLPTWRRRHSRLRSPDGLVASKLPGA